MNRINLFESDKPVALLGGAAVSDSLLDDVLGLAHAVAAADGGAAHALARGIQPHLVVGDMDSLSRADAARIPADRLHIIDEQETTDFDKALRHIAAPLVIGAGFSGTRADHALAAYTVLARHADRACLLAGEDEVVFLCPPKLALSPPEGSWFSLYPLGAVTGRSTGLAYPIDGIDFAPHLRVGTSNRVTGPVTLSLDAPLMLVILPRDELAEVATVLATGQSRWGAGI